MLNKFRFIGIDILRWQKCAFYWILLMCLSINRFSILCWTAQWVLLASITFWCNYCRGILSVSMRALRLWAFVRIYILIFSQREEYWVAFYCDLYTLISIYFCVIDRPNTSEEVISTKPCMLALRLCEYILYPRNNSIWPIIQFP